MSCPPSHICWLATSPLSPYLPHVHLADYMLQHLTSLLQIFMAPHDETSRSPPSQNATFSPPLLNSLALFFRRNLPRAHLFLHSDLELWCVSFLGFGALGAHPPSWWLLCEPPLTSCHSPGADRDVVQPGTKPGVGNLLLQFSHTKPRTPLQPLPPTALWPLPLLWLPWTPNCLKKVFPLPSPA
jgi:hypothetical protein